MMLGVFNKRLNEMHKYSADDVVAMLGLALHPEGGYYREMYRDAAMLEDGRSHSTAIYFLLTHEKDLHWHKVDAPEIWHWYGGAPLVLEVFDGHAVAKVRLSGNLMDGERPQAVVPANQWQAAKTLGDWTLVGCTMSPGFDVRHFEMAPLDWVPVPK